MVRGGGTRSGGVDEARVIWTGLERAMKDVQREARGIVVLEQGLQGKKETDENQPAEVDEEGGAVVGGLMELAIEGKGGLDGVAPSAWFWRECAACMDKRFRDACRCTIPLNTPSPPSPIILSPLCRLPANPRLLRLTIASPFLARTLRNGYSRLQSLVKDTVIGSKDVDEGYNGSEVVLMMQSIASIQQVR